MEQSQLYKHTKMYFESNLAKIRIKTSNMSKKHIVGVYWITFLNKFFVFIWFIYMWYMINALICLYGYFLNKSMPLGQKANKTNATGLIILAVLTNFIVSFNLLAIF